MINTDCREPNGVCVSLIDAIIAQLRVLRRHYEGEIKTPEVQEALKDLVSDEDLKWLLNRVEN